MQYKLGLAYELGRGAGRDDAKASSLYEAAARGGHVKAMFAYAISLDEGRGLVRDPARACLLYTSPSPRDKRQSRMPSSA